MTDTIGARTVWTQLDDAGAAITGRGVTVAVLDSGVQAVRGLDVPGKVVQGPDLSGENQTEQATGDDTFGHGTHMAGIIAANDPAGPAPGSAQVDGSIVARELGVAPDAQLLALKLAAADGSTDIARVIAGLDWVTRHRTDAGMNVRVVSLSFGATAVLPGQLDPLAAAAENAWRAGLVVVVSGGNDGVDAGSLTHPAINPYVIAVGASQPSGTPAGWRSPSVAEFSSRGTLHRHVDLVAPGRSIVALRAPGSFLDVEHPEGRVRGDKAGRLFRGSGTSQAAAVVSGAAALVLQANPDLTPDEVKAALMSTAGPLAGTTAIDSGSGQLNVAAAVAAVRARSYSAQDAKSAEQSWPAANGFGSFDSATASVLFETARWSTARWSTARWSTARWSTARWSTARWSTARWSTARWS